MHINVVSLGHTETEMAYKLMADRPDLENFAAGNLGSFRPAVPDAHMGRPEQVVAAAAFLLSPDSAHIAFHDLYIDGSETLGI